MIKAIFVAIGVVGGLVLWLLKRYAGEGAGKRRLSKRIREAEDEMYSFHVGTVEYNQYRAEWLRLNREYADRFS